MQKTAFSLIMILAALLTGCTHQEKRYRIGVSQCSEDIWRDKLNRELQVGAYFHDGVELRFVSADDSDERQIEQIDQFVSDGIDLLIVAPNQVATVTPAIDRAFDRGIPVIVFDRKTNSKKFTAYIGADNREMGRMMGEYVAAQLDGKGRVLEVMGLQGSSPAIERHEGFAAALARHPGIELVASLQGDWTEQSGYDAIRSHEGTLGDIDYVFGQNDRMAMGARRAFSQGRGRQPLFCGIDGLPGEGGGIELVRDSFLTASCIYPTHGDEVLQLAIDILEGRPFEREGRLATALVTPDNAHVLLLQSHEMERQANYLDQLHEQSASYLEQLNAQRTITLLALGGAGLLLLTVILFYLYHRGKINIQRERVVNNLWNLEHQASTQPTTREQGADSASPDGSAADHAVAADTEADAASERATSPFITRFREVVEKHLADSELSVEDLAADMNLSRVQLYRKVKQLAGVSPVELLRTARLNRGYQLLLTTDKTISEVAYAVGFTAPSYFTKCFKDEFGKSPTDLRQ